MKTKKWNYAIRLLEIGIAFSFFYVAISSLINPLPWSGFFPSFFTSIIPTKIFMPVFSVYEIVLGLWLLSNKKIFYAAILSALTMAGIVVFNLQGMDIVFRDVTIFFAAIALAVLTGDNQ
ncbi:hypothetical protein HY449_04080 [Candidatus Pacearchaeota archaeon]|nr:hypothetical protein [Candidatus Pacearchaeota archaeon]